MHTKLTLTTVRVRKARTQTLSLHKIQPKTSGSPLVEMLVHGAVRAVVEVVNEPTNAGLNVLWAEEPWASDPKAVTQCVAGALAVMKPALPKPTTAGGPTA